MRYMTEIRDDHRAKIFLPEKLAADPKRKDWMEISKPFDQWATFMTLEGDTIKCSDYYEQACRERGIEP